MNRNRSIRRCFRAAIAALCLQTVPVPASAEEFLDAARLGDRGVTFEAPQAGWDHIEGVTGVGDVDGDGFSDVLLSVLVEEPALGGQWLLVSTAVLVFGRPGMSGKHTLGPALSRKVVFKALTLHVGGGSEDLLPLGDLDRDGHADFFFNLTRFPYDDGEGGEGYLVFGSPAFPETVHVEDIGHTIRGVRFWSSIKTRTGAPSLTARMANVGDFNGDGGADVAIVTAAMDYGDRNLAGRIFILYEPLELTGRVDLADVGDSIPGVQLIGAEVPGIQQERIGEDLEWVRWVGDVDGDGLDDLLASPSFGWSPPMLQRLYLIYGARSFPKLLDLTGEEETPSGLVTLLREAGKSPYRSLHSEGLGDLNGDGHADFLFADSGTCSPAWDFEGRVWIYYGGPGRPREIDFGNPPPGRTVKFFGLPGCFFGASLAPAGDLNRDGIPDFLVGAMGSMRDGMDRTGEMYAIFGRPDFKPDVDVFLEKGFEGIRVVGQDIYDQFGSVVAAGGDFNGDGAPDFLSLATSYGIDSNDYARAYMIYGVGGKDQP